MSESKDFDLRIQLLDCNRIHCECVNTLGECEYAFQFLQDERLMFQTDYQKKPSYTYIPMEPGSYCAKTFVRNKDMEEMSAQSDTVIYEGLYPHYEEEEQLRKNGLHWGRNIKNVLMEMWTNRERMFRISVYDYRILNKDAYLGTLWNFLNPFIQIATFWFVFGFGIRAGRPVDGFPYLVWMLCGMIPWFFASACITHGASSIRQKGISVLKMRYPVTTIPLESVLVEAYSHLIMIGILLIILVLMGYMPSLHWLNLLYYFVFAVVFFTALAMVTSVLSMIALDFQKLLNSMIRLLFYLTPILWSIDNMPKNIGKILSLNPIYYYVRGFRESLLYQVPFYARPKEIAFFWGITLVLLICGCNLIAKYRDQFIDLQ